LQWLKGMIERGLTATTAMWPPIRRAFGWVHRAANILGSEKARGSAVREQLGGLLGAMARHRESVGKLGEAVDHFAKVSRSYWPGLFACYDAVGLPRTNNALEQAFGSHRYHERRATGRKGASPALVLRGSVRLIAGLASRTREVQVSELADADRDRWKRLRGELERRRDRRVERRRFRQDPQQYLKTLEDKIRQSRLPAY
jgi:hypothetical protein